MPKYAPVLEASVLGRIVGSDAPVEWEACVQGVEAAITRLAHIAQLSVFGGDMGSASYGVSKLLCAAKLYDVDRGLAPDVLRALVCWRGFSLVVGRPQISGL